jgi:hypothetical protein
MIDRVERVQLSSSESLQERKMYDATFDGYKNKLKGRLYGVLCEREKDGEWEKFLDSIIIEISGLHANCINWWPLMGKLYSLRYLSYEHFRKTIFECMNLVGCLEAPDELP